MKKDNIDLSILAKKYLHGEMSEEESQAFEASLADNPELREAFDFYLLMIEGFSEIEERNLRPTPKKAPRNKNRLSIVIILIAIFIFLATLLCYFWFKNNPQKIVPPKIQQRANQENNAADLSNPALQNVGGAIDASYSDRGYSITLNHNGDLITAGIFSGNAHFSNIELKSKGGSDIFVASSNQNIEFYQAFRAGSASGNDHLKDVAVDKNNNILVTGAFFASADFGDTLVQAVGNDDRGNMDFFVAKYTSDGKFSWLHHGGGQRIDHKQTGINQGLSVVADSENNVVVTGLYLGAPQFGNETLPSGGNNEDVFIAKYNSGGDLLWVRTITGTFMLSAFDLKTDDSGNIYTTGFFGHANLNGSANFGETTLESFGGRDIFLAKYTPGGDLLWVRQAGAALAGGSDYAKAFTIDEQGNLILTGYFEGDIQFEKTKLSNKGGNDFFIAKYDADGNFLWAKSGGGAGKRDMAYDVATDLNGNILIAGEFENAAFFDTLEKHSKGSGDAFVAKYDQNGILIWVRTFGGSSLESKADLAASIAIDLNGNCVVTGYFSGEANFGDYQLKSEGKEDIFIIILDRNGKIISTNKLLQLL